MSNFITCLHINPKTKPQNLSQDKIKSAKQKGQAYLFNCFQELKQGERFSYLDGLLDV